MAECYAASFIYLLVFSGFTAAIKSSKPYTEIGLGRELICNPSSEKTRTVDELTKMKDSAIIVTSSHSFDTWVVSYSKHCKFKIKTVKDAGLFAVIQKMSLRRNGTECLDYIRFTAENIDQKEPIISEKYCGKLYNYKGLKQYYPNIDGKEYNIESNNEEDPYEYFGRNFDISSTAGKITTEIYISKQSLKGEVLDLLITYTPFVDCDPPSTGPKIFRWLKHSNFRSTCINERFNCDDFTNCVREMCSDESNCTDSRNMYRNEIVSNETGTKVTVSAVTTIILCFIIFVLCMWICRKHKKLCWSPDCAGPTTTDNGSTSGLPMERGQQSVPNPPLVASAPMLEVVVPSSVQDKDLPPSYDSLFPTQQNTNTTTANT